MEAADTRPISSTVITVGRRADNDSSVAVIAILPALPSEEERKLPSHVSLNVVKHVARANRCDRVPLKLVSIPSLGSVR